MVFFGFLWLVFRSAQQLNSSSKLRGFGQYYIVLLVQKWSKWKTSQQLKSVRKKKFLVVSESQVNIFGKWTMVRF